MSRFLFVVPPLTGHINPTVSVGRALIERGHDVAWIGYRFKLESLLPPGARIFDVHGSYGEERLRQVAVRSGRVRGLEAMKFLWQDVLVPLGRDMRDGVNRAIDELAPDVVISDQQALAGGIAARGRDLPWASFGTSSASVVETPLPKVWNWVLDQLAALQREAGVPPVRRPDISEHLMVVFTTREMVGSGSFPDHYRFVGPSFADRTQAVEFPYDQLDRDRKRILVSLGTVNADRGRGFYRALIEVMTGKPVQVILAAPRELVGDTPDNFIVRDYVPQVDLLSHVDAVVCHGGQNTVSESLAHGLPLVVVPIKDDQSLVATQVANQGAAVRVRWGRLRSAELSAAIDRVLSDDSFRTAAERVRASFDAAGGATEAARLVEALAPGKDSQWLQAIR